MEAERGVLEKSQAELNERAEGLCSRERALELREREVESLRRKVDEEKLGIEGARQSCAEKDHELSAVERQVKERLQEVMGREVSNAQASLV